MKVLQVGKRYPPSTGGIETIIKTLAEALNRRGVHCDVLCANDAARTVRESHSGFEVTRAATFARLSSTSVAPPMVTELRAHWGKYDVLHIHAPDPMAALAVFLARPRCPIVLHWHSDIVRQRMLRSMYAPLQHWILRRADRIVAATPPYIPASADLRPFADKCTVIPYATDPATLPVKADVLAKLRLANPNRRIVLALGRLVYYKGFEVLVQAAKYLDDATTVLIGGTGPLEASLRSTIEQHGMASRVHLLGFISQAELGAHYAACDLFCLPSVERSEAFGVVQIEAMSFGKPVVATRIQGSGTDWVNQDNVSGFNVPTRDPEALARAISMTLDDSRLYRRLSSGARARFEAHFTPEVMANSFEKLYRQLTSG